MNAKIANALRLFLGLLILPAIRAPGQGQTISPTATNLTDSTGYVCVQRGPDSRIWQSATFLTNSDGEVTTNFQSYTELATGICYLTNGQYVDSVEEVTAVPGGAQAVEGRHQVYWALNANTASGAVTVITPDNKQLSSTVFGLAYFDTASGSNAPVAYLQDCTGSIAAPNQVIYANAFSNLTADLCYTYSKAGFSQNVVLRQAPPAPDRYGLSDETSIIQIYTEFFTAAQPEATAVTNGNVVDDQVLDFGDMKMGMGQTLFLNAQDAPINAGPATKQWVQVNNRTFLIESIPYQAISNQLRQLPQASNIKPGRGSIWRTAFIESKPFHPSGSKKKGGPMKFARVEAGGPRVSADYELLSSSTNLTLQGDTTYFVSGTVNITGVATIEGGTVVKYTNSSSFAQITSTNIVCQTGPYRPGVFTSMNDNSVGATISGSTGAPSRGTATYLNFESLGTNSLVLRNVRFSYADIGIFGAITALDGNSVTIWDCQFFNCGEALYADAVSYGGGGGFPIDFYNVLFSQCSGAVNDDDVGSSYLLMTAQNVTADQVGAFVDGGTNDTCYAENSVFTGTGTSRIDTAGGTCYTNATNIGVYQIVGAGSYYLAAGSSNRNVGTTDINPALLADLQTLTTYPPVLITNEFPTSSTNLSPQAPRNTGTPDRGYHYCPLDYAVNTAISDSTVTVLPGTALGMFGSAYGIWLYTNGVIQSTGTATSPNFIVRYNTVQEQSNTNWESTNWSGSIVAETYATGNSGDFVFTQWSVLASDAQLYSQSVSVPFGFMSCQFYGGQIYDKGGTISSTNSLYRRVETQLLDPGGSPSNSFYNNLFWEGSLTNKHSGAGTWTFRDNLFDQTLITNLTTNNIDVCLSNAYVTTTNGYLLPTNNAIFLTNSPPYQTGTFGQNYYPSNYVLVHAGSWSATNVGLYHYSVTTNNVIESNSIVSIGFHYVAVGTNGLPLDSNGEGIPDYLADANGNGIDDPGEIPWNSPYIANPGGEAVLLASSSGGTSYQWEWNGATLCGETSSTLTISPVDATNAGTYTVITTIGGYQTSYTPILCTGPEVIVQPQDYITPYSNNAIFSVTAIGSSFTYQWQLNGANIPSKTNSMLVVSSATQTNAGSYTVLLSSQLEGNPYTVTSSNAVLTVTEPTIIISETNFLVEPGSNVSFITTVLGTPEVYSYYWYEQSRTNAVGTWNSNFVGDSITLTLPSVTSADSGVYKLWVFTQDDTIEAASQEINLYVDPAITNQPRNQIVDVGSNVMFAVGAWTSNMNFLRYQWWSNTNNNSNSISWATNTTMTLSNITTNCTGTYWVVVSNTNTGATVTSPQYDGILSVRTPIWLTTSSYPTNHVSYYYQSFSSNGTIYWYQVQSPADYTAILTSSIPRIVHYDAGVFQTTGSINGLTNTNTAQAGWQHWGNTNTNTPTTIQLTCNTTNYYPNYIFGAYDPHRTDGFELHDLTLDCNANGQPQRQYTNTGDWDGVSTCGNNIVISNVIFIHFGKQGNKEDFPLQIIPSQVLDENSHLITLYSNITVENCTFESPATDNLTNFAGLTTATILPGCGADGTVFNLTNCGFSNCVIFNVTSDFGYSHGFAALSVRNCVVNGCQRAVYWEIPGPAYYGQNYSIQSNYFTNVQCGVNLYYNGDTGEPTAVGSITLVSNVIWLTNVPSPGWGAGVSITGPNILSYAIPQIPSLTAQYNLINTVVGDQEWGFYLWNISSAEVSFNSLNNSNLGISLDKNVNQPSRPISFLVANHNTNGGELIDITGGVSVLTPPNTATQQKGDFNLDGYTDLLWRNMSTGQNVLWPMDGTNTNSCGGALSSNGVVALAGNWVISGTADFTGDCNNDILWTMPGTTNVLLWTMQGPSFICSNWMPALLSSAYGAVGTGDFNGDGKSDIVTTNGTGPTIRFMNGTNKISDVPLTNNPPTLAAQVVGVGEFSGGEQADILWRDYTTGSNFLWVMQGTNVLGTTNLAKQGDSNWQVQGVGDFNGDGIADILWRHAVTGSNEIWLTSNPLSTNYTLVILPQVTNTNWAIAGPK